MNKKALIYPLIFVFSSTTLASNIKNRVDGVGTKQLGIKQRIEMLEAENAQLAEQIATLQQSISTETIYLEDYQPATGLLRDGVKVFDRRKVDGNGNVNPCNSMTRQTVSKTPRTDGSVEIDSQWVFYKDNGDYCFSGLYSHVEDDRGSYSTIGRSTDEAGNILSVETFDKPLYVWLKEMQIGKTFGGGAPKSKLTIRLVMLWSAITLKI